MNPAEFANIARTEETFWWYRGMERVLFGVLDHLSAGRSFRSVLEGGCGTGFLAKRLQDRYRWPVHALDLGAEGLEFARQKYGVTRVVQGDLAKLPFRDASFDLVLSMDVIVHFPRGHEQPAFDELARVLAPGGLCVIRVSALDWLRSRHSQFAAERQRFTRPRLISQLKQAGLQVDRCTYLNSLLVPVAAAKFRIWEPLTRQPAQSGVEPVSPWLNRLLEIPLGLEAKWIGGGHNFPVGQSLLAVARKPS
jgi:SAM-dependent methyltransferase